MRERERESVRPAFTFRLRYCNGKYFTYVCNYISLFILTFSIEPTFIRLLVYIEYLISINFILLARSRKALCIFLNVTINNNNNRQFT